MRGTTCVIRGASRLRRGAVRSEVARLDLAESVRHLPPGPSAGRRGTEVTQSARRRFWMCVRTRVHRRAKRLAPRTLRALCAGLAALRCAAGARPRALGPLAWVSMRGKVNGIFRLGRNPLPTDACSPRFYPHSSPATWPGAC